MVMLSRRGLIKIGLLASAGSSLGGCGAGSGGSGATTASSDASATGSAAPIPAATPTPTFSWKRLKVGAGGWIVGLDVQADGTKLCRTDTSGAYRWDTDHWTPIVTMTSMPTGHLGRGAGGLPGVYEICAAPSKTSVIYMVFNGKLYRSDDRGAHFAHQAALPDLYAAANDDFRMRGRRMAVRPSDPLTVAVAGQNGALHLTRDGGTTWSLPQGVPAPLTLSGYRLAWDGDTLYAHSDGAGLFVSRDLGTTFSALPGGPLGSRHMIVGRNGDVFLTDVGGDLWLRRAGAWSSPFQGRNLHAIAIGPTQTIALDAGGGIYGSPDGAQGWHRIGDTAHEANDVPWLAWTNENYMSAGDCAFDADGSLWFGEGIGVWRSTTSDQPQNHWVSMSAGIEQLVSNCLLKPPGEPLLYLAWDRPVFALDDLTKYPTKHGPDATFPRASIVMGWAADYAPEDPRFVVGLISWAGVQASGTSADGGRTWTDWAAVTPDMTAGKIGGCIAVSSKTNWIVISSNNGVPYRTKDGGKSFAACQLPGAPAAGGETGWGWAYYFKRFVVSADKTTPGTFYAYNYLTGLYVTVDGGDTWTKVAEIATVAPGGWTSFHARLHCVPGKKGHLFFTSGQDQWVAARRSVDGGKTWQDVPGPLVQVNAFGFGAPKAAGGYPAVFAYGNMNGAWGVFRSDDNCTSWVPLGDYPCDSGDGVIWLEGDPDVFGRVYGAFGGSGGFYGEIA